MSMPKKTPEFYPPHKYDKDGFLKPSKIYYFIITYLLRGYLIIVMASTYGSDTNAILGAFYPNGKGLYLNLVVGIPALIALGMLTYRSQLRDKDKAHTLKLVKPLLFLSLTADISSQLYNISLIHWRFDQVLASMLLFGLVSVLTLLRVREPEIHH